MAEELRLMESFLKLKPLNELVKLDLKISCKMSLLLVIAVEQGMEVAGAGNILKRIVSEDEQLKLMDVVVEILRKSGAEEYYELVRQMTKV